MRKTIIIGALLALAGCTSSTQTISDDRMKQMGITCEGAMTITGNFKASMAQPADVDGCWPVGTWTFSAKQTSTDCSSPQALLSQYQFQVTSDADGNQDYQYLTKPNDTNAVVRVSSGGGSLCEGELLYFSDDGKTVITLKPHLYADGHLDGQGTYERYTTDQR